MPKSYKRVGRPTKLDKKKREELFRTIRAGNYVETACAFIGISKVSFYKWLKRGARLKDQLEADPNMELTEEDIEYLEFHNDIQKATAEAEIRDVTLIARAAEHNWQAAAWRLERRAYERWGRKDRHELTGKDGGAIEFDVSETRKQVLSRIAKYADRTGEDSIPEETDE